MSKIGNSSDRGLPESKESQAPPSKQLLSRLLRKIQIIAVLAIEMLNRMTRLAFKQSFNWKKSTAIATLVAVTVIVGHAVSAQVIPSPLPLVSLKTRQVPQPSEQELQKFIKNKVEAIALGKSLFWDMQVGSDGIQSCASCHFHAGADSRAKNQISPGLLRVNADNSPNPDLAFDTGGKANYQLKPEDFPFHKLADPNNRQSSVVATSNDIASSQGVSYSEAVKDPRTGQNVVDYTKPDPDGFKIGNVNVRRVEPRNTPTTINAVFNFRNFWDGRAQDIFNGVNPFGLRDPNAFVYQAIGSNKLEKAYVRLTNSSLASQAVGPPLSSFEMSANGRTFQQIGDQFIRNKRGGHGGKNSQLPRKLAKKLMTVRPLAQQLVHPEDSVLGSYSSVPKLGLKTTYEAMIQNAFKPEWWKSNKIIQVQDDGSSTVVNRPDRSLATSEYTLMEYNFPLFFGLAVQMYESTLVSDNSPFDQFMEGNANALTESQKRGLNIFNQSGCIFCHSGAEFTAASVANVKANGRLSVGPAGVEDTGFFGIGVTPAKEDLGVGGEDAGISLSEARLAQQGKFQEIFKEAPNRTVNPDTLVAADGLFKAPGLRNIELTAPYMHNGGMLTLRQVVDFYARGAADDNPNRPLLPILTAPGSVLDSADKKEDLVAFLKSLTDERVRYDRAPFDHPQLFVPNGHPEKNGLPATDRTGKAVDSLMEIPAVGRNGLKSPLPNFLCTYQNPNCL